MMWAINWHTKNGDMMKEPLGFSEVLDRVAKFTITSRTMSKEIADLVKDIYDSTRLWVNNGYTLN